MASKSILVTGGAGYIGSHACKALAKAGFSPIAYDNLSTGHASAVKWGPLVQADLADRKSLRDAFLRYQPEAVLHFAASALVVESVSDPGKYYSNNVIASLSLLEVMREFGVPHIVFSSSCATYGQPGEVPINESHPQRPINPYGRSKRMVEEILFDFGFAHGIRSAILRYFNVAGADLEAEIGEDHTPETHLVPIAIQAALGQREELVVYGTDFPTPDGSALRDYIHVEELVQVHIAALQRLCRKNESFCCNLGSCQGYSVLDVIRAVEEMGGKKVPLRYEKRREGEPSCLVADHRLAQELLQWQPQRSLHDMIASAWKWHSR
ncbi:MAG: UDP-glucose 4-epimerase GalE [Verrucomicrobiota bacterium]|nr:UDP-glucose 4-epimerase GalE [Verrucomicrobiota bacterium]